MDGSHMGKESRCSARLTHRVTFCVRLLSFLAIKMCPKRVLLLPRLPSEHICPVGAQMLTLSYGTVFPVSHASVLEGKGGGCAPCRPDSSWDLCPGCRHWGHQEVTQNKRGWGRTGLELGDFPQTSRLDLVPAQLLCLLHVPSASLVSVDSRTLQLSVPVTSLREGLYASFPHALYISAWYVLWVGLLLLQQFPLTSPC